MSSVVSEMLIRIAADTAQLRSELNQAKRAVGDGFDGIKSAASSLRNTLVGIFAGIGAAALAKSFVETADAVSLLDARLKNTAGSGAAFAEAQKAIYQIAQANNIGLQEATELFTKLNDPVKRLGGSASETAGIVESFATSLRLGGASATEAASATLQFAQAMASGRLNGDEFRSLAEASPRFMRALAEGMNVPIEKLKQMSGEGKLTADVVGNALLKSLGKMKEEAASLPDTIGGAMQRLRNDITVAVSELNNSSGLTLGIAGLVETVRTDLVPAIRSELASAFEAVGAWIQKNRDWIAQVWEVVKNVSAQVWEAVKAFGSLAGAIAQAVGQSGAWKAVLEGIRFAVAGLQDGFNIIRAAVLWLSGDRAGANAIFDAFKNGQSAVQQYANEMMTAKERAAQMDAALAAGAISASENSAEMAKLARQTGGVGAASTEAVAGYKTLKSALGDTKEQEKAAESYKKLISSITDKIASVRAEAAAGRSLSDAEKMELQIKLQLANGTLKLSAEQRKSVAAKLASYKATLDQAKAEKELAQAQIAVAQHSAKLKDAQWQQADALRQSNVALIEQNAKLRMGEQAYAAHERATLLDQAAQLEFQAATEGGNAALEEQARLLRDRARLLQEGESLEAAKRTAEEWKKTAETIENDLTEALMRGFESGKSIFQALRDSVVNMFKNLVLRPIIAPIAGGLASIFGGPAFAGGGVGGGVGMPGFGGLGNMFSGVGSFFNGSMLTNMASFGVEGIGNWLVNNTSGFLNNLGGTLLQNSYGLGSIFGGAGNAFAGYGISKALSGGYKTGLPVDEIAAIASAIPGIGPIAGVVGGLVNRAFGRKLKDAGIEGTFGVGDGFEGNQYEFYKGGWFRSDKTKRKELDPEVDRLLTTTFNEIKASTKDMAGALGLNAEEIDSFTQTIKFSTKGLTEEQVAEKLGEQFGLVRDNMIALYEDALLPLQREGETLTQTFDRLMVIQQFREAINPLGGIFGQVAAASIQAQENIIALSGGLESFLGRANAFVQDYYTEAEKAGMAAVGVADRLESVGIDLAAMGVDTRAEFRALVESIDVSTEQGQAQLAALLEVAPQFAQLADYMAQNNATLQQLADQAPQTEMLQALIDPQQSTASNTENIATGVQQSNTLLGQINGQLGTIGQIAQAAANAAAAAAAAAGQAASAAGQAASSASLAASRPTYSVDVGAAR